MFGSAGFEYLETYDASADLFAKVAVKTRRHAARNPYALFTAPLTVEDVLENLRGFGEAVAEARGMVWEERWEPGVRVIRVSVR